MSENNSQNSGLKVGNELVDELRELKNARDQGSDSSIQITGSDLDGAITCTKCGTDRVAKSRPQGLDSLRMRFIPQRPYRCLHCYNRFWQREGLFADKQRGLAIGLLLLFVLAAIALTFIGSDDKPSSGWTSTPIENPNNRADEAGADINDELNNSADQQPGMSQPTDKQRAMVENLDFNLTPFTGEGQESELSEAEKAAVAAAQAEAELLNKAEKEEKESLLKVEIAYRVEQWRKAWEAGNTSAYFNSYSKDFVPADNQTPLAWQTQRKRRVRPARDINLTLESFDVKFSDNYRRIIVDFVQHYRSKTYLEISKKRLVMVKEGDSWKISSEQELNAG